MVLEKEMKKRIIYQGKMDELLKGMHKSCLCTTFLHMTSRFIFFSNILTSHVEIQISMSYLYTHNTCTRHTTTPIIIIQLDLGYPAISYPDISIIRPRSCSILSIVYIVYFQLQTLQSCSRQKQSS